MCLLDIDSGSNILKYMSRFLGDGRSRKVRDLILSAQAHGVIESFTIFDRYFTQ